METKPGAALRGTDEEQRREAARLMGKARTPAKIAAGVANIGSINAKRQEEGYPEETRQKLRDRWAERKERKRLQQEALSPLITHFALPETVEASQKRGPGRPRTRPLVEAGEKRGKGRPPGSPNKPKSQKEQEPAT